MSSMARKSSSLYRVNNWYQWQISDANVICSRFFNQQIQTFDQTVNKMFRFSIESISFHFFYREARSTFALLEYVSVTKCGTYFLQFIRIGRLFDSFWSYLSIISFALIALEIPNIGRPGDSIKSSKACLHELFSLVYVLRFSSAFFCIPWIDRLVGSLPSLLHTIFLKAVRTCNHIMSLWIKCHRCCFSASLSNNLTSLDRQGSLTPTDIRHETHQMQNKIKTKHIKKTFPPLSHTVST